MSWLDIKGLDEQRAALVGKAGEILKRAKLDNREVTPEENQEWTNLHAEASKCEERAKTLKTQGDAEKSVNELIGRSNESPVTSDKDLATRAFYKKNLARGVLTPDEQRALSSAGTGFVPDTFAQTFIDVQKFDGNVIEAGATVYRTDNGRAFEIPRIDDTAQTGELVAQNAALATNITDPTVDSVTLQAYIYDSGIVKLPVMLARDAAFSLDQWLAPQLSRRTVRKYGLDLTTGDGTNKPNGVIAGGTVGKTCASATAFTYNETLDLIHSVNRWYRRNPAECRFMMNDATLLYLKKMVDGAGNPLWNAGNVGAGIPATLDGYQYVINPHMADVGASAKFMAFGNFKEGYAVRIVNDIQVVFLDQLYMANLQYGYISYIELDGEVTNAAAYKVMANAAS